MNISRVEHQQAVWRQEQTSLQLQREEEYRKLIDKRKFDEIVAARPSLKHHQSGLRTMDKDQNLG
jgi:hypothetical protein